MAVSPIKFIQERSRQEITGDDKYYKSRLYFFELRVPQEISLTSGNTYLLPLVISPDSYAMSEPFALQETPTLGGGLYTEENGIIQRTIRIEGTTGFKPRPFKGGTIPSSALLTPEQKSFSRELPGFVKELLSGHRHFQYLQDAVFRTYGDLKKDPATSEDTALFFHNVKDDEHWEVKPRRFDLTRNSGDRTRTLYNYSIELLVVGPAEDRDIKFSEDKALLDEVKDAIRDVAKAGQAMAGAINDIVAIVDEIANVIKDVAAIIDTVTQIIDAIDNFIQGVTELVQAPFAIIESAAGLIEQALDTFNSAEELGNTVRSFPENVVQKFRQMKDSIERVGSHPEVFETPSQRKVRDIKARQSLSTSASAEALATAAASTPPQSLDAFGSIGTTILPGDAQAAQSGVNAGQRVFNFTGTRSVEVGQGDTLINLAAKFMGDARLWQHIAVVNGLKPPFVDEDASKELLSDTSPLPGTLGIGDKILIPNFSKAPAARPLLPVLGVTSEQPAEEHLLGTDFELERYGGRDGAPLYDIAVDADLGSSDFKKVRGNENMVQGTFLRVTTERGTDVLYKRMGVQRIIGLGNSLVDQETARFRFAQAIRQDPRVASVRKLQVLASDENNPDALIIDAEVEVRGFAESSDVRVTV